MTFSSDIIKGSFLQLCSHVRPTRGKTHLLLGKWVFFLFFLFLLFIIVVSHLEVVDLHEGLLRVQGVFDRGGARLTDLAGALQARPAQTQERHASTWTNVHGTYRMRKTGEYF